MAPHGLRRALDDGSAVIVAGAGVSIALAKPGTAPTWAGLLQAGLERVQSRSPGATDEWRAITDLLIKSGVADDLVMAASRVTKLLRSHGGDYGEWLQQSVGHLDVADPGLAIALAKLEAPVFTTNYDTLLERVLGRDTITWREPQLVQLALQGDRQYITHLHGVFTRPDTVIFGLESYEELKHSSAFQALEQALVMARTLVFVGAGQTNADPNLGRLLGWLSATLATSQRQHYQLVLSTDRTSLGPAVEPVVYGASHGELIGYLDSLITGSVSTSSAPLAGAKATVVQSARSFQNLPRRNTLLVGREQELAWVMDEVQKPGSFVVIEGPAGCGKTTVALEAAHRLWESDPRRFDATVWLSAQSEVLFADGPALSSEVAKEVQDVLATIAIVLDRQDISHSTERLKATLVRTALAELRTLIVFDNFESAVDRRILAFLRSLPESCNVLVTSRRNLFIGSALRLGPLNDSESRELLIRRLTDRGLEPRKFDLDRIQAAADGLPLAIEWMSGRLLASPAGAQVADFEAESDGLLNYLFLGTAEWLRSQGYLRALLGVVCLPSGAPAAVIEEALASVGEPPRRTSDALTALLNLNLVRFDEFNHRYQALPIVARFVLLHLADPEVVPAADLDHVEISVAASFGRHLLTEGERLWSGDYSLMDWAAERQNAFDTIRRCLAAGRDDLAVPCVIAVYPFAITFGHLEEFITWAEKLLTSPATGPIQRLELRARLASAFFHLSRFDRAVEETDRIAKETEGALDLPNELKNFIYFVRSIVAVKRRDDDAERLLNEAIAFEQERGVLWARLGFQGWLVLHLANLTRLSEARELAEASLKEARGKTDRRSEVFLWYVLARVYNLAGEHSLVLDGANVLADPPKAYGEVHNRAHLCVELGRASLALGQREKAASFISEALHLYRTVAMVSEIEECQGLLTALDAQK